MTNHSYYDLSPDYRTRIAIRAARYATTWDSDKVEAFAAWAGQTFGWQRADRFDDQAFGDAIRRFHKADEVTQ